MICPSCGVESGEPGAPFCARCGAALPAAPPAGWSPPPPAWGAPPAAGGYRPPPAAGTYQPAPAQVPPAGYPAPEPRTDYLSTPPPAPWSPANAPQPAPDGERHRVSRRALLTSVGAVLVVAAGAVTAVVLTSGSSAGGGASTPQAAVTGAIQAATRQDVDGVLSYVDPAEARTLGALVSSARSKASAGGVLSASGVPLPWLSVQAKGVTVKIVAEHANVAFVTVTGGTFDATIDENKIPAAQRPAHPTVQHKSATVTGHNLDTKYGHVDTSSIIGVVKVNGSWYLSPTTTVLEQVRQNAGLPEPDFDHPAKLGPGASSPGDIYSGLAAALSSHNLSAAAGFVSQSELPEIAAYFPVFASQISSNFEQTDFSASGITTSTQSMSNGLVRVQLDSATVHTPNGDLSYSGGCISANGQRRCEPSEFTELSGWKYPFVVVGQDNGGWRIQPIATVMEYLREAVTNGNTDALYRRMGFFRGAPVTATLHVGGGQQVPMNGGGFANVVVKASPNACLSAPGGPKMIWYGDEDDSGDTPCYRVPSSGQIEATVLGRESQSGPVTVDIVSR